MKKHLEKKAMHFQTFTLFLDCPLGYHNINCSEMCNFPSFGEDCQGTCRCDISHCDHRSGCITLNGTLSIFISFQTIEMVLIDVFIR